jgi:hypothetical protein
LPARESTTSDLSLSYDCSASSQHPEKEAARVVPDVVIENPIPNASFREPARHWAFGDTGITNEIVDGRRVSSYKNTEWESEREYRFIARSASEYEFVDVGTALVAVCRGSESVREAEHALRHFANELGIAIGYLQWDHNNPMLLGRPLSNRAASIE